MDNKPTIDINLNDVINCTNSKNEVALQFRRENDVVGDALAEMRFYVPSAEDSQTSDGGLSGPEAIVRRVSELSDLDSGSGQLVVAFDKLQMLVPRLFNLSLCFCSVYFPHQVATILTSFFTVLSEELAPSVAFSL